MVLFPPLAGPKAKAEVFSSNTGATYWVSAQAPSAALGTGAAIGTVNQIGPIVTVLVVSGAGATAMCTDLGARTIRDELDALRVMGINPIQALVVPRVLAATTVSLALSATVILVGLSGAFFFCVFIQHVSAGAFVAGLTLLTGTADVVVSMVKAMLFGLGAGLIACYKGISVSGGPAGVGNAVNETVVFTFMVLFAINVIVTAVGITVNPYIEYYADNLPERRLGVFGIGLILCGFTLQSIQYWLALLDVRLT